MTSKSELIEELKKFLQDKREELEQQADEEALPLQEELQDADGALYEYSKAEYNKILTNLSDCAELIKEIETVLDNTGRGVVKKWKA